MPSRIVISTPIPPRLRFSPGRSINQPSTSANGLALKAGLESRPCTPSQGQSSKSPFPTRNRLWASHVKLKLLGWTVRDGRPPRQSRSHAHPHGHIRPPCNAGCRPLRRIGAASEYFNYQAPRCLKIVTNIETSQPRRHGSSPQAAPYQPLSRGAVNYVTRVLELADPPRCVGRSYAHTLPHHGLSPNARTPPP